MRRRDGFTLVELLVVIAIIGILATMQVRAGMKAVRQAKAVAAGEAMRQNRIFKMTDDGKIDVAMTRSHCRAAFRKMFETGKDQAAVTEVLFALHNDTEFDAYYHTLVDPDAEDELIFENDTLIAKTKSGATVRLEPLNDRNGGVAISWEFLATNMAHMTTGSVIKVMYNDFHVEDLRYPGRFPASRIVAECGQDFMDKTSQ